MKILVPFNSEELLDAFVEEGAGEFYMGFYDPAWSEQFGEYSDINRLTLFKETANRYTIDDVARIAGRLHEKDIPLYITLNAPGYRRDQMDYIRASIDKLAESGVDGIILGIPELISYVREKGLKAIASTMCGINNHGLAQLYRDWGMNRVILPRELTAQEITSVMQYVPDLEYEVFLMRNGCRYTDANCLGLHGGEQGALCYSLRTEEAEIIGRNWDGSGWFEEQMRDTHEKFCTVYHEFSCGQCAIWRFLQAGVNAVKIVGRLDDMTEVLGDIRLTAANIAIAAGCTSEQAYFERMMMPGSIEDYCRQGMSCYYPEIRWG